MAGDLNFEPCQPGFPICRGRSNQSVQQLERPVVR